MTADIVYTTSILPPAFIGIPYEAAVAYYGAASAVTDQSIVDDMLDGLPGGLSLDDVGDFPGSLRITGTPDGTASSGSAQTGVGSYVFAVSATDTADVAQSDHYVIVVYYSPASPKLMEDLSVEDQSAMRNL